MLPSLARLPLATGEKWARTEEPSAPEEDISIVLSSDAKPESRPYWGAAPTALRGARRSRRAKAKSTGADYEDEPLDLDTAMGYLQSFLDTVFKYGQQKDDGTNYFDGFGALLNQLIDAKRLQEAEGLMDLLHKAMGYAFVDEDEQNQINNASAKLYSLLPKSDAQDETLETESLEDDDTAETEDEDNSPYSMWLDRQFDEISNDFMHFVDYIGEQEAQLPGYHRMWPDFEKAMIIVEAMIANSYHLNDAKELLDLMERASRNGVPDAFYGQQYRNRIQAANQVLPRS